MRDGICLRHVSDAERGERAKGGEENRKPFAAKPPFDIDHGPAHPGAVFLSVAVFDAQRFFSIICHHA